jgi:phosphomannomutase
MAEQLAAAWKCPPSAHDSTAPNTCGGTLPDEEIPDYILRMSVLMLSVSGCRGIVGESLSPEVIARFAGSYGTWLRRRAAGKPVRVILGRDGRAGSDMVRASAIGGLLGSGCSVVDIGVAMTPTTAVATDAYARGEYGDSSAAYTAGMVLTASHNPQQWNGLKCLLAEGGLHGSAACAPPATCANEIIELFRTAAPGALTVPWNQIGRLTEDDTVLDMHVSRVLAALEESGLTDDASTIGAGLRVAVDSVNGSGAEGARMMLEALGCDDVLLMGADSSGIFPHPPEPTLENLSAPGGLCDAVRESQCDAGFAQDPDADRLAIIDDTGAYIGEEYTLALGARAIVGESTPAGDDANVLVTNLSTSRMLEDIASGAGGSVLRTAVGEANVVEAMKARRSVLGGEGNGGVIWPRVAYVRDSLAAMALTLWLISPNGGGKGTKRPLSSLIKGMPSYAIEKRKVDLRSKDDARPAVDKLTKAYAAERVDLQDGCRVDFASKRAWLHVRASNTEPIMRLIAEAPDKQTAKDILDAAAKVIG